MEAGRFSPLARRDCACVYGLPNPCLASPGTHAFAVTVYEDNPINRRPGIVVGSSTAEVVSERIVESGEQFDLWEIHLGLDMYIDGLVPGSVYWPPHAR